MAGAVQEDDPGSGPDAAHPDHLAGDLAEPVLLQQVAAVGRQALAVAAQEVLEHLLHLLELHLREELLEGDDQRGVADDAALAVDDVRQLVECPHGCPSSAPWPPAWSPSPPSAPVSSSPRWRPGTPATPRPPMRPRGSTRPPNSTGSPSGASPPGTSARAPTIAWVRTALGWPLLRPAITTLAASRLTSHSHGPGMRLVEVVAVEDELPLGCPEHAEVGEMRVPAELGHQARARRGREVRGHDERGAAEEGEGGDQHPAVADGHQLLHPALGLLLEQRHGIGPVRGWFERGVELPGDLGPGLLAGSPCTPPHSGAGRAIRGAPPAGPPCSSAMLGHLPDTSPHHRSGSEATTTGILFASAALADGRGGSVRGPSCDPAPIPCRSFPAGPPGVTMAEPRCGDEGQTSDGGRGRSERTGRLRAPGCSVPPHPRPPAGPGSVRPSASSPTPSGAATTRPWSRRCSNSASAAAGSPRWA